MDAEASECENTHLPRHRCGSAYTHKLGLLLVEYSYEIPLKKTKEGIQLLR